MKWGWRVMSWVTFDEAQEMPRKGFGRVVIIVGC